MDQITCIHNSKFIRKLEQNYLVFQKMLQKIFKFFFYQAPDYDFTRQEALSPIFRIRCKKYMKNSLKTTFGM